MMQPKRLTKSAITKQALIQNQLAADAADIIRQLLQERQAMDGAVDNLMFEAHGNDTNKIGLAVAAINLARKTRLEA